MRGTATPFFMPHSRWNELPPEALRQAGYTLLSWSAVGGADTFVRQHGSLLLVLPGTPGVRGHDAAQGIPARRRALPERHAAALSDAAGRVPVAGLAPTGSRPSRPRRSRIAARSCSSGFPFAAVAAALVNTWQPSAVALYRNWLARITDARQHSARGRTGIMGRKAMNDVSATALRRPSCAHAC